MKKRYLNNRDLLTEIHKSKLTYCSFIDPAFADYDTIVSDVSEVQLPDIRYRVQCVDHVPMATTPRERSKSPALVGRLKVIFAPFKHFIIRYGEPFEVGRSHWLGDFETGRFSQTHGRVTNRLGLMFMALVTQYAKKPNWRGYSYLEEMQSSALVQLTSEGLKFDEAKGQNPFAYLTQVVHNAFIKVANAEKKHQTIRDDLRMSVGLNPSMGVQLADKL